LLRQKTPHFPITPEQIAEDARRIIGLPPYSANSIVWERAMNVTTGVADLEPNGSVEATCLRLNAKAADAASITPAIERRSLSRRQGEVVVAIEAAGVNPSDVKAATGLMPYAVFPRTPGRDFSGVVVDGPREWMGKAVFGTSGDLGIRRDGTHASHLVVEAAALLEMPPAISMDEAAGIGVPFVTAIEGFRRSGMPRPGETVVIMGVNGKVGQVAVQLATWQGAKVIGVVRKDEPYEGYANAPVEVVNSATTDVARRVHELTDGRGADIVFNTVGDPYFKDANRSLAKGGRQILIAAVQPAVEFNILEFYRGRHTYVGIDTLAFSSIESADVLRSVMPGFAGGFLRPFPIAASSIYPLGDAKAAYAAVIGSSRDRIVLRPKA
jgi:NADPH:quinone reductase